MIDSIEIYANGTSQEIMHEKEEIKQNNKRKECKND